jgi:uncharacterized protein (TIGR03435 family)
MRILATSLLLLGAGAASAQNFEVASIKAAAPQDAGRVMVRMGGDPGRLDYTNVSLRDLVRQAYGVKDYQVVGPDWMNSARFDVQAKLPPDTPQDVRNVMMQHLLADRFALKVHKESKEAPIYSLNVAKGGPKLKPADPNAMAQFQGPGGPGLPGGKPGDSGPGGPAGGVSAGGGANVNVNRPGGPGGPGGPGRGGVMMMRMGQGGNQALSAKSMTMQNFADMLARFTGKPVVDQTGITGIYDIDLEFKPEDGAGMMRGVPMPMPRPDGAGPGAVAPAEGTETGASIFTALQDQLGLKLDAKKGPVETIVVDTVNKTPTEN